MPLNPSEMGGGQSERQDGRAGRSPDTGDDAVQASSTLSEVGGYWTWRERAGGVTVVFAGRGPAGSVEEVLERITGERRPVARARQVHSARVLAARAGESGEGDALVAGESGVALSIVTADCVPVLISGRRGVAAAHAGWRGIAAGVVRATLEALGGSPAQGVAWIGPAIGPCCYETGLEVAELVAAASDASVVAPSPSGRPHVDLPAAVRHQLQAAGLRHIRHLSLCTRCETAHLHSYRREGKGAGRNHAFIWKD